MWARICIRREDLGLRRLFVPIGASLITGFLLTKYFPQARGSGIPQTKTALFLQGGRIRVKTILGRFFCSALALGCGISLGREGPSVQIGSGLASTVGRKLRLSQDNIKALIPVGAAAALAAAFNTPIAAVLFSLEEIMGDLHAPLLGSVVISAATSWVVLHLFLGDNPLFPRARLSVDAPGRVWGVRNSGRARRICLGGVCEDDPGNAHALEAATGFHRLVPAGNWRTGGGRHRVLYSPS